MPRRAPPIRHWQPADQPPPCGVAERPPVRCFATTQAKGAVTCKRCRRILRHLEVLDDLQAHAQQRRPKGTAARPATWIPLPTPALGEPPPSCTFCGAPAGTHARFRFPPCTPKDWEIVALCAHCFRQRGPELRGLTKWDRKYLGYDP